MATVDSNGHVRERSMIQRFTQMHFSPVCLVCTRVRLIFDITDTECTVMSPESTVTVVTSMGTGRRGGSARGRPVTREGSAGKPRRASAVARPRGRDFRRPADDGAGRLCELCANAPAAKGCLETGTGTGAGTGTDRYRAVLVPVPAPGPVPAPVPVRSGTDRYRRWLCVWPTGL